MAEDGRAESELSFSDELILREIRAGRRDPEIAVMLGVTIGNLRLRIDRLMRVSGAASREGLGWWEPGTAVPEIEPGAGSPEPFAERRHFPWVTAGLAGLSAIVAAAAIGWFVTRGDGENSLTPAATETAAPAIPPGPVVRKLRFVAAEPYPEDLLLYIVRGCEGCSAPIALDRVYRDGRGDLHTDVVFRPDSSSGRHILAVWARRDASDLVVSVCDRGSCGARGPVTADAMTRFYRSRDGGASWSDIGAVDGVGETVSGSVGDLVLVRIERGDAGIAYEVVGGDGNLDAASLIPQGPPPEFTLLSRLDQQTVQGLSRINTAANGVFAYTWYPYSPSPDVDGVATRLGVADRFGNTTALYEYVGAPLSLGAWLDPNTVTATVSLPNGAVAGGDPAEAPRIHVPVLVDLVRGTVSALPEPFTNQRYGPATNEVAAAIRGRFIEVQGGAASCTQVLSAPMYGAREVSCLADGALVTLVETRMVGGEEWQGVTVPSGRSGWIQPADTGNLD